MGCRNALKQCNFKSQEKARGQRLTPVILATQEAEIRRLAAQSQCRQIVCETVPQKHLTQKGLVEWIKV
jgi:hypothetical protein